MKQTRNILLALLFGAIVGLALNLFAPHLFTPLNQYVFDPVGKLFIKLIKMLVVPIVFFSIALGAAGIGDPKKLGRIGGKAISFFLVTTALAIMLAMALALVLSPGKVGSIDTAASQAYEPKGEPPSVVDTFLNIVPDNPIQAMVNGDMLAIIFFAVLVGFALAMLREKSPTFYNFIEEGNNIMLYLVTVVMKTAPYGTFALIASAIGKQGFDAMGKMALYMVTILIALFLHTVIVYGGAVKLLAKKSPVWFFKNFFPVMTIGFSTSSSSASLPVAMKTAQEKLGVPRSISSFVQPLGATINMDGTAIMQGVATIFIAQVYGVTLTFEQLIMVVLTAVLASIGTAGVPGVGLIMLAMVLDQVNLPVEGIALIMGVDRLLDMTRTAVNITGDAVCALAVAESEKKHSSPNEKIA
ncbi:dicarboxylate/amino acid:cation symporter [Priestia taiwanensis]|uniref:Sodium:dicarboxylate symporter n=1 Tax=Priestia taiwanensis TaxID=1347902 RepID=A0A917EQV2_9BACI|nr:dicarboxylate/amino acid:cation symporter [Priestia taiwanensis]MBM7363100.1 Na+/H+-dicarboxylate symporter [Priestia taiwanensis]GGE67703.1 sodium:dicarboxylate symporter [Priestia taiwanensis]